MKRKIKLACFAAITAFSIVLGNISASAVVYTTTNSTYVTEYDSNDIYITSSYILTVDETQLVTRTSGKYDNDNLGWIINFNGEQKLNRSAENEMSYRPMDYGDGVYRVWLTAWVDGGYKRVSNVIEWVVNSKYEKTLPEPQLQVTDIKTSMKSIIKHLDIGGADVEYKRGFVIDPNGDGEYNGCIMFAGRNSSGEEVQHIFDNDDHQISFSTSDITEHNVLYVWCDKVTGRDYIVRVQKDVNGSFTGTDCCTGTEVFTKNGSDVTVFGQKADLTRIMGDDWFTCHSDDKLDSDHFYVSTNGNAVLEGA